MNSLRGRDTWPLLKISDDLIDQLRTMGAKSASPAAMIDFLHAQGVPKAGAVVALRLAKVMPSAETKLAVHNHEAYAYRREADEAFEESVARSLDKLDRSEAAA